MNDYPRESGYKMTLGQNEELEPIGYLEDMQPLINNNKEIYKKTSPFKAFPYTNEVTQEDTTRR